MSIDHSSIPGAKACAVENGTLPPPNGLYSVNRLSRVNRCDEGLLTLIVLAQSFPRTTHAARRTMFTCVGE